MVLFLVGCTGGTKPSTVPPPNPSPAAETQADPNMKTECINGVLYDVGSNIGGKWMVFKNGKDIAC
jgi:hypothetical protein